MKKKILTIIIAVLAVCLPLTACGEKYRGGKAADTPDVTKGYVVVSNGGSAVQYGNFVYFINGYRGYDDDGEQNYWGNVVKGGLYKAELVGKDKDYEYISSFGIRQTKRKDGTQLKTFESTLDTDMSSIDAEARDDVRDVYYDFVSEVHQEVVGYKKDEDGNFVYENEGDATPVEEKKWVKNVAAQRIASKTVGTSGFSGGGIFIYDDYVYYATPSNKQNRQGEFEVAKTSFFRTSLDGTKTQKLYTTKEDSNSSEYAFYKQNDKVYLVVHEGTSIISVTVEKKVTKVEEIATDVTGVLFPVRDVYFDGIDTNQPEDFVYYTRAINDSDVVRAGNLAIAMRPDGTEAVQILATGNTVTLKNVDGGYLFYQDGRLSGNVILYSNLHDQLYGVLASGADGEITGGSESYRKSYDEKLNDIKKANGANSALIGAQSGTALNIENIGDYSEIYCYRPNRLSNQVYSVCMASGKIDVFDGKDLVTAYSGSISRIYGLKGQKLFFGDGSGNYYYTNAFLPESENSVFKLGESMNTEATFGLDIMGDFVMMFGSVDDYASDYAIFVNVSRVEFDGSDAVSAADKQFVGERTDDDKYDPAAELNSSEDEDDSSN